MKTTIGTGVLAVLAGTGALAGVPDAPSARTLSPAEREELLAVREKAWTSWFGNDQAALTAMLPPETLTIPASGPDWHDRSGVLQSAREFAKGSPKLTSLVFPRTEIQAYGGVAIVYSTYEVEWEGASGRTRLTGRATEFFLRQDGRWLHPGWHLDAAAQP